MWRIFHSIYSLRTSLLYSLISLSTSKITAKCTGYKRYNWTLLSKEVFAETSHTSRSVWQCRLFRAFWLFAETIVETLQIRSKQYWHWYSFRNRSTDTLLRSSTLSRKMRWPWPLISQREALALGMSKSSVRMRKEGASKLQASYTSHATLSIGQLWNGLRR